jgi:hypothetical protein
VRGEEAAGGVEKELEEKAKKEQQAAGGEPRKEVEEQARGKGGATGATVWSWQ